MDRDKLIECIKAVGEDLIECSESIVPQNCELMKTYRIWIDIDGNFVTLIPDVQYEASYVSKNGIRRASETI